MPVWFGYDTMQDVVMRGRTSMKRTMLAGGLLGLSALAVSGCMGPTYGTGKPATEQLLEDVTGAVSLAPRRSAPIAYQPRPDLVQPPTTTVLPTPQAPATETAGNWPESPEMRRARIRAEATENQDNIFYRSPLQTTSTAAVSDADEARDMSLLTPDQQRAEYQRRAAQRAGSETQRRFLSEPPLEYRVPSATAPANELGEDEWRKERQIRRASGSGGWRDWVPWL